MALSYSDRTPAEVWQSLRDGAEVSQEIEQSRPSEGVVYTRPRLVSLCLDIAERVMKGQLTKANILDVGCGYGQFIGVLARRVALRARKSGASFEELRHLLTTQLRGVEIRRSSGEVAKQVVRHAVGEVYGRELDSGSLGRIIHIDDFLKCESGSNQYDLVVGNLPYVRYDKIPTLEAGMSREALRRSYSVFSGRADYSIPFLDRICAVLRESGISVIITSNRFTRAAYGSGLRSMLSESPWEVHEIDIGDVAGFEETVSAYASIFLLKPDSGDKSVYVKVRNRTEETFDSLAQSFPQVQETSAQIKYTKRDIRGKDGDTWSPLAYGATEVLRELKKRCVSLSELECTVRKGPATGANDVYIGSPGDFPFSEVTRAEVLLPLFHWNGGEWGDQSERFLLNVYEHGTGRLKDLDELPEEAASYLKAREKALSDRYIVRQKGKKWWSMIDPFDPSIQEKEKILVPDLRPASDVVYDSGKFVPGHNAVYVYGPDRKVLSGLHSVLKSRLSEMYRFWKSPDLGRGSPRASSTILRDMPVPSLGVLEELGAEECDETAVLKGYGIERQYWEWFVDQE